MASHVAGIIMARPAVERRTARPRAANRDWHRAATANGVNSRHLTPEVETIISLAKEFARQYGQNYVGTEHLLLAIIGEEEGAGARVLAELAVDVDRAKAEIDTLLKDRMAETWVMGRLPGTPHYRDVLARALEQAKGTGNWQIRSEHLLLALLAERNSTGCKALQNLGVTPDAVRKCLTRNRPA